MVLSEEGWEIDRCLILSEYPVVNTMVNYINTFSSGTVCFVDYT